MNRALTLFAAAAIALTAAALLTDEAHARSCTGNWSLVMAGLQFTQERGSWQDSSYMTGDQRVGYNVLDPLSGERELDRLFWEHRALCPRDHIKMVGHSEGAALVHVWVTDHSKVSNANAVLLADPKRFGRDGVGVSWFGNFLGYPLAGVDDWFGSFPVLSLCRRDDGVCAAAAGSVGYVSGHHMWYDLDARGYTNDARGTVML